MSLENVQPGDTLIWHTDFGRIKRLITVVRVTKTQIVIDGFKFRKTDGYRIGFGSTMNRSQVTIPSDHEIEEIFRSKLSSQQ